jgi:hypothetical protein
LKYLIVLSIAARKSSLEPMSLTATCGEVTVGLGMLLGCSGQVRSKGQKGIYLSRLLDVPDAGQTRSAWANAGAGDSVAAKCQVLEPNHHLAPFPGVHCFQVEHLLNSF